MSTGWFQVLAVGGSLVLSAAATNAQIVTFKAVDTGASVIGPFPNSDAAAASFDAAAGALGSVNLIDFESAPVGAFSNLLAAPGVSITGADLFGADHEIRDAPCSNGCGFNTRSGGAQYAQLNGGTLTFTFAAPVQAFGAYLTGLEIGLQAITFDDGAPQLLSLPTSGRGAAFFCFTDAGKSISSITVFARWESIGIDDVRYVGAVPEPASYALMLAGPGALGFMVRRRRI